MEINFYIWLILTIAVTAYSWILIAKWTKAKKILETTIPRKLIVCCKKNI